jgi:hypothetical protein
LQPVKPAHLSGGRAITTKAAGPTAPPKALSKCPRTFGGANSPEKPPPEAATCPMTDKNQCSLSFYISSIYILYFISFVIKNINKKKDIITIAGE